MASVTTAATTAPNAKYLSRLANARVLVLGGSSGIGKAVAEAAVEHGAIVVISSSNEKKLAAAVDYLGGKYPDRKDFITSHVCNLLEKDKVESNIEKLLAYASKFTPAGVDNPDGIDHIVYTAGDFIQTPPLTDLTLESLEQANLVRHFGCLLLAKHSLNYMKKSPSSSFSLTNGVLARKPLPGLVSVAAAGMALEGVKNGLVVDMQPIRVNSVNPGAVPTESWEGRPVEYMKELFTEKTTTKVLGTPEDMAEAYLYLMKDKFVTGATIETNGGAFYV